jgi:WD40 repeat protein
MPTLQPPRTQVGTSMPRPRAAISSENADKVIELARWGKGTVSQVAYSGNGKLLAVASSLGIYLHDAQTLKEIGFIQTEFVVTRIAVSPDGQSIAGVLDGPDCNCDPNVSVRLWLFKGGDWQSTWQKSMSDVKELAFLADGKSLMVAQRQEIALLQVTDGALLRKLDGNGYSAVAFLPISETPVVGMEGSMEMRTSNGELQDKIKLPEPDDWDSISDIAANSQIVVGITNENGTIYIWHVRERRIITIRDANGHGYVALSPDGTRVAAGHGDGWVRLYQASDGKLLCTLKGHDIGGVSVVFSPDSSKLITVSGDGVIRLWRASDGVLLQSLPGHAYPAPGPILSFKGEILASARGRTIELRRTRDGSLLRVWQVPANGNPRTNFEGPVGAVSDLALSPDGAILASGMDDGLIHLWRVSDEALLKTLDDNCRPRDMVFSPDGRILIAGGNDISCSMVRVWRMSDTTVLYSGDAGEFSLSYDGKIIAISVGSIWENPSGIVELLKANDGTSLATLNVGPNRIRRLIFSPDGKTLAVAAESGTIQLWRVDEAVLLHQLNGHTKAVLEVDFSPDGQLLASASQDGTSKLWNVMDGKLLHTLDERVGWAPNVAFSSDGNLLATVAGDYAVRLWRTRDGALLRVLYGHTWWTNNLSFLSSRLLLSGGSYDGTVRLWGVAP